MVHGSRIRRLAAFAGVIATVLALSACEASISTANISDAWMSADQEGAERVTAYPPDAVFYAQVDLSNAPDETLLKTSWIAVDVEGADPGLVIDEVETATGSGMAYFTLTNDGPWPPGAYKVDIYLDGELDRTLEFSVE